MTGTKKASPKASPLQNTQVNLNNYAIMKARLGDVDKMHTALNSGYKVTVSNQEQFDAVNAFTPAARALEKCTDNQAFNHALNECLHFMDIIRIGMVNDEIQLVKLGGEVCP